MKIFVAGLNHKTASVDVREKLAFDAEQLREAMGILKNRFSEVEFVLVSTCNRVEFYIAGNIEKSWLAVVVDFLSEFHGIEQEEFKSFLYMHEDEDAVRHLFMVASSLDSMVVGETEIIGQIKDSYSLASKTKSTGKILNRLFHSAFSTGKKVHTKTSIASGRVSVAGVAVELAGQLFADVSSAKIVLIGAGQTGQLLLQHLLKIGCKDIAIINRSYERAVETARKNNVAACKWEDIGRQLGDANIVIASAAVQDYLFSKETFTEIVSSGLKESLLIIDIGVPRNFDSAIGQIEGVHLYSIDELSGIAEENLKAREDDIAEGMQIVYKNAADFMDWFKSRDIGPLIGEMKEQFSKITRDELDKLFSTVGQDGERKDMAEATARKIVNKLMHRVIRDVDIIAKKHGAAEAAKQVEDIVKQAKDISSGLNGKESVRS